MLYTEDKDNKIVHMYDLPREIEHDIVSLIETLCQNIDDAVHSSTLEGFKLNIEEVENGKTLPEGKDESKSLREWINMVNRIPKEATNGDMIKVMFPNAKIGRGFYGIGNTPLICLNVGTNSVAYEMTFIEDWWNAPYNQKVEE